MKNKKRIRGLQANTSAKSPEELDGSEELQTEDPQHFADLMLKAYRQGTLILGGCCGTNKDHIEALGERLTTAQESI